MVANNPFRASRLGLAIMTWASSCAGAGAAPFNATVLTGSGAVAAAYDPDHTDNLRLVGARLAMDKIMVEPARFVAGALAARGLATYEYRFSYVATSMRDQWKTFAPHATEIPYVFETVAVKYDHLSSTDAAMAPPPTPIG